MMLEPGERQTTLEAQDNEALVGFVVGIGNTANRNKHSMYCVIGVVQAAADMGLGNRLMAELENWAKAHGFTRLELTVIAHNERAKRLYLARGFDIEGTKRNSRLVDGKYVDELYMSKVW